MYGLIVTLITIILAFAIVAALLWLTNTYVIMPQPFKTMVNAIIILVFVLVLLYAFVGGHTPFYLNH